MSRFLTWLAFLVGCASAQPILATSSAMAPDASTTVTMTHEHWTGAAWGQP
jgi:hypothetical protein